jgi:cyclase
MDSSSFRPRLIPVLLVHENALVKSIQFKNHRYLGDPLNAARLFNEMGADELIVLDISAGKKKRSIDPKLVESISNETRMPLAVGGGVSDLSTIRQLIEAGAEKIIIGSAAIENPSFVAAACTAFGSSTITVCLDVKQSFFGKHYIATQNGQIAHPVDVVKTAIDMEKMGVGELILQSIQSDGTMKGYDIKTLQEIDQAVSIPIVALGGAGTMTDIQTLRQQTTISAFAASSLFVYHGKNKGFLIHYPSAQVRKELLLKPSL